jgi:cellulose biosynthesis protein BcsQ
MLSEDELRAGLDRALRSAGVEVAEILLHPDPFEGWRVVVIERSSSREVPASSAWLPLELDREIALLSFRAADERDDADELLAASLADRPLWPEALARGQLRPERAPRFAADLNAALEPPLVATFYSLRGGVGRSTALAHVAQILARDNRVLCVDMDLEAPGLAALFGVEEQVLHWQGVVPLLVSLDLGGEPELDEHIIRVDPGTDLYLLPAGLPSADYARQLAQVDPAAYYQEETNPLRDLLALVRSSRLQFDVILLDSRTGISPLSAPLLFDLADLAVVTFFPHPQAFRGTGALVRALLRAKTERLVADEPLTPSPHFLVSPIPAADRETVERYEERALDHLASWVSDAEFPDGVKVFSSDRLAEITTFVTYSDAIATSDDVRGSGDLRRPYEPLAEWIAGYLPGEDPVATGSGRVAIDQIGAAPDVLVADVESALVRALSQLPFDASVAEEQDRSDLFDSFVRTRATDIALRPETMLITGRKGTGKTAIFRRLRELADESVVVVAPSRLRDPWTLGPNEFEAVDRDRRAAGQEWRVVWQLVTALVVARSVAAIPPPEVSHLINFLRTPEPTATDLTFDLRRMLDYPDVALLSRDWLLRLDAGSAGRRFLLFDGLDAGFGGSPADLERRTAAVSGLLELVGDMGDVLRGLSFKVLLREDILGAVNFPNKSHFFGRQVQLRWEDTAEYLNVAVKRAMRSDAFQELLSATVDPEERGFLAIPVDRWPAEISQRAWRLLVGDRIAGSKTAFTANWVWRRLADGNDDHSPRSLVQLLMSARGREEAVRQHSGPTRSVIRPRMLVDSLEEVSAQARIALREEYTELEPVFDALRRIGRTPFDAPELAVPADLRRLAEDVGLLTAAVGPSGEPRFKVPDLYRLDLEMGRKGQR